MDAFRSIPFEPRELKATPDILERIYAASKLGIKGDALAFAAGLLPMEYRRLLALDRAASIAEAKGRADSEVEAAAVVRDAAMGGDSKAALALLTMLHDWMPKQQINVDIKSQISITAALQEAESRVIEGRVLQGEGLALTDDRGLQSLSLSGAGTALGHDVAEPIALEQQSATADL
jgi:hypothetical protein